MYIVNHSDIVGLSISPADCVSWVHDALLSKEEVDLPPKISLKLGCNIFFNTMPCYIPSLNRIGVKIVSRYPLNSPALSSKIFLLDSETGNVISLIDGDWITAMRTGAVAALSIMKLEATNTRIYSFVGLGNTARATLLCLLEARKDIHHKVRVLRYKNQADDFIKRFSTYRNVDFEVVDSSDELVFGADVIVSCVTAFDSNFADDSLYKEGVLLVPVHTRGFQNCDLFFDKIYGDDRGHVQDFKYFDRFKYFNEFVQVLNGTDIGRTNDYERIIAYNIGIALHDVYFAAKMMEEIDKLKLSKVKFDSATEKFWV